MHLLRGKVQVLRLSLNLKPQGMRSMFSMRRKKWAIESSWSVGGLNASTQSTQIHL